VSWERSLTQATLPPRRPLQKALDKQIAEIQTCRSKIEQLTKSKSTVVAKIEKYSDEVVQAKAVRDVRPSLGSSAIRVL